MLDTACGADFRLNLLLCSERGSFRYSLSWNSLPDPSGIRFLEVSPHEQTVLEQIRFFPATFTLSRLRLPLGDPGTRAASAVKSYRLLV